MPTTQQLTITVLDEVAKAVKTKVASGEFASEGEAFSESFLHYAVADPEEYDETLGMGEEAFSEWLRKEAVPVLEAMKADPSRGRTHAQVRERLAREHANFRKAG